MAETDGFGTLFDFGGLSDGFDVISGSRSISAPPSMDPHRKHHKSTSPNLSKASLSHHMPIPHKSIARSVTSLGNVKRTSTLGAVNWKFISPDRNESPIAKHADNHRKSQEIHNLSRSHISQTNEDNDIVLHADEMENDEEDFADILKSQLCGEIYDESERDVINQYLSKIKEEENDVLIDKDMDPIDELDEHFEDKDQNKTGMHKSTTGLSISQKTEPPTPITVIKPISASTLISTCKKEIESSITPGPVNKRIVIKLTPMNMSKGSFTSPASKTPSLVSGPVSEGDQTPSKPKDLKFLAQSSTASIIVQKTPANLNARVNKQLQDAFQDYPLNEELEKLKGELGLGNNEESSASGRESHPKKPINPKMLAGIQKLEIREVSHLELPIEWEKVTTIENDLGRRKRGDDSNSVHPRLQSTDFIIV